ncbi:hypothetical protein BU14_2823s0001 [Porphyra umbilicalis]|uniref:Uncharacterized protein n=1 Tax=Porphyra umbilicalis TaxID=2786 RepID=A0A1X6NII2_PORUM|nr:hypothetical protein BU14_2823s0001 [Porphyra umbilicalis]|eukprot:OSX68427.1 hypothetical protein BU14_2823s0001 [Porphyra umbilicalis]
MHSFLLSETFMYAYLAQEETGAESYAPGAWVFNTEAHPLLVQPRLGVDPVMGADGALRVAQRKVGGAKFRKARDE